MTNEHQRQLTDADLGQRFDYHPPRSENRKMQHESVRDECHYLANRLNNMLPDGREKALVVTKLEEVMFWANAALARSEDPNAEAEAST